MMLKVFIMFDGKCGDEIDDFISCKNCNCPKTENRPGGKELRVKTAKTNSKNLKYSTPSIRDHTKLQVLVSRINSYLPSQTTIPLLTLDASACS